MFETLFKYPGVLARHRGGPFADRRERFLIHCADQKMANATLLRIARELLVVADRIDLTIERQISVSQIEAVADEWCSDQVYYVASTFATLLLKMRVTGRTPHFGGGHI